MLQLSGTRRALAGSMLLSAALALLAACSDASPRATTSPAADSTATTDLSGDLWSDAHTWPGGVLPAPNADVEIPAGKRVILNVSPARIRTLTVRGELVIANADVNLSAARVDVYGTMRVGSPSAPYLHHLTVTLTDGTTDDLRKGIVVQSGGDLEMFGEQRVMWTRLSQNAAAGATTINVDSLTNWRAGDAIVLTSTDVMQDQTELEYLAAPANGHALSITRPLAFDHFGTMQTIAGKPLDERAEVGLLTHNIVVQGDSASETSGIGAHVMVLMGGTAHVDGVEFFRAGQRGHLGRYPFHWHLAGSVPGQFVKHSSVWHSFNRCMTIHGTEDATLIDNVCYDHVGHGYFLEDGIETGNTLRDNLGVYSRAGTLIPTDAIPATFWITNPDNTIENNVAGGSMAMGFWIAASKHPTGPSATDAMWPQNMALKRFDGNVAHSNAQGFHVEGPVDTFGSPYTDYRPRSGGTPDGQPVESVMSNIASYKNRQGFWGRGDHMHIVNSTFADNQRGVQIGDAGLESDSRVSGSVFIGASANWAPFPVAPTGFMLYDGPVHLEDDLFANYGSMSGGGSGIGTVPGFDGRMSSRNDARSLTFVNAVGVLMSAAPKLDGERDVILQDLDGSVTGHVGGSVVTTTPIARDSTCTSKAEWSAYACGSPHAALWISNGAHIAPAIVTRDDGVTDEFDGYTYSEVDLNVPTEHVYNVAPKGATDDHFSFESEYLLPGDWIMASMPWNASGATTYAMENLQIVGTTPIVATREALMNSAVTAVWIDTSAHRAYVRFVGVAGKLHQHVAMRDPQ